MAPTVRRLMQPKPKRLGREFHLERRAELLRKLTEAHIPDTRRRAAIDAIIATPLDDHLSMVEIAERALRHRKPK